jgi:hypothetical protein
MDYPGDSAVAPKSTQWFDSLRPFRLYSTDIVERPFLERMYPPLNLPLRAGMQECIPLPAARACAGVHPVPDHRTFRLPSRKC